LIDNAIGMAYMLKLVHLVDDKIHALPAGRYSLGTAAFGQHTTGRSALERNMEPRSIWGSIHFARKLLTVKSDDMQGRNRSS